MVEITAKHQFAWDERGIVVFLNTVTVPYHGGGRRK
jgi:hypothetical protein